MTWIILNAVGGCEKYDDSCNGSSFNIEMDCIYHKICHCLESSKLVQEAYDYTYYFYAFTIEFSILSGKWNAIKLELFAKMGFF